MRSYNDRHALILGLGDTGLAMAVWMQRLGVASIRVWDSRANPPQLAALREVLPEATFVSGEFGEPAAELQGVHLLLKSPGLSPRDARIAPLIELARQTGVPVLGELDLFVQALADLKTERQYAPAVLAITGTNGKTTTTCMTALLAERAGKRVAVAGNIGPSMLGMLGQALDLEPEPVLELAVEAPLDMPAEAVEVVEATPSESATEAMANEAMADAELSVDVPAVEAEPSPEEVAEPVAEAAETAEIAAPAAVAATVLEQSTMEMVDALLDEAPLPIKPPPKGPVFEVLPEVWVLELSSFQLDGVQGFEPTAATVLNITQDHLDWHGDMADYSRAKARVFGEQGLMVINRDDPLVEAMVPAAVLVKQGRGRAAKSVSRRVTRFGLDAPDRPGDFGLVEEGGMAWLVRAREVDETIKRKKGDDEEEISLQRLMPADALRVRGRHNASNALAALALASAADCALAPMLHGLREYRGEPHRVEHVATIDGIDFYDDSKGTNVGATVAAITGLGADRDPAKLVLILGGDGKGQDFSPLAAGVARHARAVALIGRDGPQIAAALAETGVPLQSHESLEAATAWCLEQAQGTDSVLLSPACASLDMFRNYAHRAEVFVAAVQSLAADRGLSA
ncbi:UDP-N-acetylmuramoyl-L-alanine--D-glutamate ligase [Paucibacter sp. KBW04]|uniref:UDP-N-acetylmuramoyl-L-alanine--D-glutamate ligase n=1 Tax=Paucibacter sp. KBW04 TaxID=2153361 RepID=UPI000F56B022|nr:UDP-N-acetylmuramoyl-L-alanine--D-glutamate ligase [Paucibacter sp. KBW04]RQO62468.1 UDP-N-acetylmuramoyl-L-alanine--D-glutamate ligase [Paucibacter sp. KBW04]